MVNTIQIKEKNKNVKIILLSLIIILLIAFTIYLSSKGIYREKTTVKNYASLSDEKNNFEYPIHKNIIATVFWVGEGESDENEYISNADSAWDDKWLEHFGGVDEPTNRLDFKPAKFEPKENFFYFALPYNDFYDNGSRKAEAYSVVYWSAERNWSDNESMLKNRWIKISRNNKTAYAQWEDAGPFLYDDYKYVFGNEKPQNKILEKAGIDLSPAIAEYLEIEGSGLVNWSFVDYSDVPNGPWKEIVTTRNIHWG
jgi:hypothetical protein